MRLRELWLALGVGLAVAGCPKKEDVIIEHTAERPLTDAEIDADPLALLPGGAVGVVSGDAKTLFASSFGERLATMARAPIPPAAGFEPTRDLERMVLGFYSMQGADFAAVATGTFDRARIEGAADGTQQTPLGAPLVKSSYAGRELYTSRNVGFVVLTARTVILGNETGIRRALDRIKEGRVRRALPEGFEELAKTPGAALVAAFDLRAQPLPDAARSHLPFMNELETARVLGNFEPPGMNLAGTLTYPDNEKAEQGSQTMRALADNAQAFGWLINLLGIPQPIRKLETQVVERETKFVAALDGEAMAGLLERGARMMGIPVQPKVIPATMTPGQAP
ncbi:MAG: hypothetical protein KF718_18035 [Polyangiaceae bacterium]|nr:hypothetical protein [Polyangiaceae bacterium]